VTTIYFAYDVPFPECIHTHIEIYSCIISPQLSLVSCTDDVVIVGVDVGAGVSTDVDIDIHATRELPSRRQAALVTNR
jgi:hypothetical protein